MSSEHSCHFRPRLFGGMEEVGKEVCSFHLFGNHKLRKCFRDKGENMEEISSTQKPKELTSLLTSFHLLPHNILFYYINYYFFFPIFMLTSLVLPHRKRNLTSHSSSLPMRIPKELLSFPDTKRG